MTIENAALYAFNRGLISSLALARVDLKRSALSAAIFNNWMPRALGSMMLRPGLAYKGSTHSNAAAKYIPFVFATTDTALLELTDSTLRVWVSEAPIERAAVSSAVSNSDFTADLTSWTDSSEAGGSVAWVTGGYCGFTGNGTAAAILDQTVTVAAADQGTEHALRIVVNRGPLTLRIGSTSGGDEYIGETVLGTGTHSLALTPTGDFYIRFFSRFTRQVLLDSCTVESSGVVTLPAPWTAAELDSVRWDQSADVIYLAATSTRQQRKIERRGTTSWSIVLYQPEDGPFELINTGPTTITASALDGNITLAASNPLFDSGHVGALWRITSNGQDVSASVTAENSFTNAIEVTGIDSGKALRAFTIAISGTWSGTVTLQRSFDSDTGPWTDVSTYTANTTTSYDDALDNADVWYRIGVKTGDFTSGTIDISLNFSTGYIDGIVRITGYTDSKNVDAEVLTPLGGTVATDLWFEGSWSDVRGWPTSVAFVGGRLAWAGQDNTWLSVSDSYESFLDTTQGDSAPITKTIGSGPVDTINFLLELQRLIVGAQGTEFVCKSSSLDEPLTVSNSQIKAASTQGSAAVAPVKVDKTGIYVQRGGTRLMKIAFDQYYEYASTNLTLFVPEVTQPSIVRIAVQRQPDTRIHCIRSDGKAAVLVFDPAEDILCWLTVETDGTIEDVVVLPGADGTPEDAVYYVVNRTINGSTVRYLERWALESDCQGSTNNYQADSYYLFSAGTATTTITGLSHLEAATVCVWANGKDLGTYTVAGGSIIVSEAVTAACVGLVYTAQFQSSKLAYAARLGTALTQKKKVSHLGVILQNTHYQGLQYGRDFDHLNDLPLVKDGAAVGADTVYSTFDEEAFSFDGSWDTDSRLCLQAQAPRPCTALAAVVSVETREKY